MKRILLGVYLIFLLVPLYWLFSMGFKTNAEITGGVTLFPQDPTLEHFTTLLTEARWRQPFIDSLIYVCINTVLSVAVALPAAYAFSRYRFLGDKHLFFWLLSNRMAPPMVFAMPFFLFYNNAIGIHDTHLAVALAHMLFNVPLAVWILEGFISGIPRQIDETAYLEGYSFPRFFLKIFLPLIAPGVGVTAFFCFMFSWIEVVLAQTLTNDQIIPIVVQMMTTRTPEGMNWGLFAAAGTLATLPGIVVIWFVRHQVAKGFALGRV